MEHENQTRARGYNAQNRQWDQRNDDANYQQQGAWGGQSDWNDQEHSRVSYMPDNEDNRRSGSGGYNSGAYGSMGNQQAGNFGAYNNDWQQGRRNQGQDYGSASYGRQQYNEQESNDQYGYSGGAHAYGAGYGNRDYGRSQLGHHYGSGGSSFQNQGYGSSADGYRSGYQGSSRNFSNSKDRNYSGSRQAHNDNNRSWWDRTRDEVASWFGDDDAERRRDMERNSNSGPYYGKGPRGYQRSQERIKEDVCDRLSDDRMLDASNIEVDVQGNDVILSGNVHSKEEKRRAEDLVERISGVKNVENRLRIDHSATGTDSWSPSIGL